MGYVLFWLIVLGLLLWRKALQDPEWGQKWPDRELADPEREQAVLAAVGPVECGLAVSVRYVEWSAEQGPGSWRGTRIVVSGACPELNISVGSGSDVDVGDAALDGALSLIGPPLLVRAIMDSPTRKALLDLARSSCVRSGSFRVRDGQVRVDVLRPPLGRDPADAIARLALAVAKSVQAPADVPARLAANAREDPEPGVRVSNLNTLVREFPDHALTATALRAAATDSDGDVRLAAGRALGAEGRPIVMAVAADTTVDDSCSAHAMDALRDVSAPELGEILAAAQRPERGRGGPARPHTARACVEALTRLGEDAVPLLGEALRSENEVVALAAIRALDKIGGPATVIPLQEAVEHHGGEVRQAAATALADVQARLTGTPGQISLAVGDTGQVSLADDVEGRVSLQTPAGRTAEAQLTDRHRPRQQ